MSWIIGDGGRREANTAAQAANLKAAEQKLKGAKLAGKRELDTALSRRAALIASLETLAAQEAASQNELEIMWSQLATGQTTVRQLIQAEEKAYRTSDQRISVASELLKIDFEMLATRAFCQSGWELTPIKPQLRQQNDGFDRIKTYGTER